MRDWSFVVTVCATGVVAGAGRSVKSKFAAWVLGDPAHEVSILMPAVGAVGR
jgi:hypothetical protein